MGLQVQEEREALEEGVKGGETDSGGGICVAFGGNKRGNKASREASARSRD